MNKCKDCKFYSLNSLNCKYWDNKWRKKHPQASFLNENTNHNCPDFRRKIKLKGGIKK